MALKLQTNNLIHLQNFEKGAERKSRFCQKKKCYSGEIIMQRFLSGPKFSQYLHVSKLAETPTRISRAAPPDGAALLAARTHELLLLLPPPLF